MCNQAAKRHRASAPRDGVASSIPPSRTAPSWRRHRGGVPRRCGIRLQISRVVGGGARRTGCDRRSRAAALGEVVGDIVVVGLVGDVDMRAGPEPGRLVEGAGRDLDLVEADAVPEQARAANPAKAAPRPLGRAVSGEAALLDQAEIAARRHRIGAEMAMKAPALAAMAVDGVAARRARRETYRAAQTTAHQLWLIAHRPRAPGRPTRQATLASVSSALSSERDSWTTLPPPVSST